MAATIHRVAAVVRPRTEKPCRMIAPAPMKPMPVTICAAMRVGSNVTPLAWENAKSPQAYAETSVNSAAPTETSMCVRKPASRSRSSRSIPMTPPSAAAAASRTRISQVARSGTFGCDGAILLGADPFDAPRGELEQLVELLPRERRPLRRRLHVDERAVARHDDVEIDVGLGVLGVVEVE